MAKKRITVFWRGPSGQKTPVQLDISVFRELVFWLTIAEDPQPMTLEEAAGHLVPAALMLTEALVKAGHHDLAENLIRAAMALRNETGK